MSVLLPATACGLPSTATESWARPTLDVSHLLDSYVVSALVLDIIPCRAYPVARGLMRARTQLVGRKYRRTTLHTVHYEV